MKPLTFHVIYEGRFFEFDEGLKAHIFHLGLRAGHAKKYGIKSLLYYVEVVSNCYYADSNDPSIEDMAEFISRRWRSVKYMDRYELLDYYYDHIS